MRIAFDGTVDLACNELLRVRLECDIVKLFKPSDRHTIICQLHVELLAIRPRYIEERKKLVQCAPRPLSDGKTADGQTCYKIASRYTLSLERDGDNGHLMEI